MVSDCLTIFHFKQVQSKSIKTLEFIEETFKKIGKELPPNESIKLTSDEIGILLFFCYNPIQAMKLIK